MLIAGDFNSRYGSLGGRRTEDPAPPPASSKLIHTISSSTRTTPTHGRADRADTALSTSRSHGGTETELDYFLAGADVHYDIPPPWTWDMLPQQLCCHRPISIHLRTLRQETTRDKLSRIRRARRHIPAYNHAEAWHAAAETLRLQHAVLPTTASTRSIDDLANTWKRAADTHLSTPGNSLRSRTLKSFDGLTLPPQIREAALTARATGDHAAQAAVRESAKLHIRTTLRALTRKASQLRAGDAHGHARLLKRLNGDGALTTSSTPTIGDITVDGRPVPASAAFSTHYKDLLTENRPPPPGAAEQHKWIPRPDPHVPGPTLDRLFTAEEIYEVIWKRTKSETPSRCGPHCNECDLAAARHADWRAGRTALPPPQLPILRPSRAPGPDGIPSELLCFARLEDRNAERDRRADMCADIATRFNDILISGSSTHLSQLTTCSTFPVPKGNAPPASTDGYRGITISSITAKLLSLALTRRTTHWALHHGLIDSAQAGFLPRCSAEQHVWTLMEALKSRRRRKLSSCALFVDLRKAYDKVHLASLWSLLGHMGAPTLYIDLLSNLAAQRTTTVSADGVSCNPFRVSAGVPQGDPLSCILFVLFIEPLSRQLDATPEAGISIGAHQRLSRLLFADDVVVLFEQPHNAQFIACIVNSWCAAWGATIGMGGGKTELIFFPSSDTNAAPPGLPSVTIGADRCCWVRSYRYLGVIIQDNLRLDSHNGKLLSTLRSGFHDEILRSPIMRDYAPLGVQLQRLGQCAINASTYCLSILPHNDISNRERDSTTLKIARGMLNFPEGTCSALTWATARLLPAGALVARERERLLLALTLTPSPGIATCTLRTLLLEPPSPESTTGTHRNWLHETLLLRQRHLSRGALLFHPECYDAVPTSAHCYSRSVAASILTHDIDNNRTNAHAPATCTSMGSGKHAEALSNDWSALRAPISLGTGHGFTPITAFGPGCSGSLAALSMHGRYPATVAASLGTEALERWPFSPVTRSSPYPSTYSSRFAERSCPLCDSQQLSLYHIATSCTAPNLVAWRANLDDHIRASFQPIVNDAASFIGIAAPPLPLEPLDLIHIRYRYLLGRPWSADMAPLAATSARCAGRIFERLRVPHHYLREWVDKWLSSSDKFIRSLATAWRSAVPILVPNA